MTKIKPRHPLPSLIVITDDTLEDPLAPLTQALHTGSFPSLSVLLRLPSRSDRTLLDLGHRLRDLTRRVGARLWVHQRPDIARLLNADGLHLPQTGLCLDDARTLASVTSLVTPSVTTFGRSCHTTDELIAAQREDADYAFLSPLGSVPNKNTPLGIAAFRPMVQAAELPVYALGGVTAQDIASVRHSGAAGVAVIRAVSRAAEPREALLSLLQHMA